ncbi:hypothetical protein GGF46_003069 [Coemansia sp. RSA 552]|nr:hypothetical protein GGF46_003069 [Coemansia sp. RSA 552]
MDGTVGGTANTALFVIQIMSAASGFVITASCLFLRRWHPPIAYTAAFHISFWIGVQAMITHAGSAISVRLPDSSNHMQDSKPLVRFLVWAQFAMPLWFVFLNAAIATDLMLSQLVRLSATKLQAVHKWYLPVASLLAFTLTLPLLIYHSAYRPDSNVFSVQFPSALSVTLYYILAFDVWLAIGIVYCFVVVSLVVGVLLVKLRYKRAVWNRQNLVQDSWLPVTPEEPPVPAASASRSRLPAQAPVRPGHTDHRKGRRASQTLENAGLGGGKPDVCEGNDDRIDPNQVRTFAQPSAHNPNEDARRTLTAMPKPPRISSAAPAGTHPSDTLMSGVTFNEDSLARISSSEGVAKQARTNSSSSMLPRMPPRSSEDLLDQKEKPGNPPHPRMSRTGAALKAPQIDLPSNYTSLTGEGAHSIDAIRRSVYGDSPPEHQASRTHRRPRRFLLNLSNLPPQITLRSRNRTFLSSNSSTSPFRIPTLALVRLLLYPLIPIFSFTLMCIVRWVWFRSTMPSRWEILNVVSGFLRALEGLLCLLVFLLNPALNRSFREIRKRNTPVFTQ